MATSPAQIATRQAVGGVKRATPGTQGTVYSNTPYLRAIDAQKATAAKSAVQSAVTGAGNAASMGLRAQPAPTPTPAPSQPTPPPQQPSSPYGQAQGAMSQQGRKGEQYSSGASKAEVGIKYTQSPSPPSTGQTSAPLENENGDVKMQPNVDDTTTAVDYANSFYEDAYNKALSETGGQGDLARASADAAFMDKYGMSYADFQSSVNQGEVPSAISYSESKASSPDLIMAEYERALQEVGVDPFSQADMDQAYETTMAAARMQVQELIRIQDSRMGALGITGTGAAQAAMSAQIQQVMTDADDRAAGRYMEMKKANASDRVADLQRAADLARAADDFEAKVFFEAQKAKAAFEESLIEAITSGPTAIMAIMGAEQVEQNGLAFLQDMLWEYVDNTPEGERSAIDIFKILMDRAFVIKPGGSDEDQPWQVAWHPGGPEGYKRDNPDAEFPPGTF